MDINTFKLNYSLSHIKIDKKCYKKYLKVICEEFDVPVPKVTFNDKKIKHAYAYYFPCSKTIRLYDDARDLDILLHELCHYLMHKNGWDLVRTRHYHGKSFWSYYLYCHYLLKQRKMI